MNREQKGILLAIVGLAIFAWFVQGWAGVANVVIGLVAGWTLAYFLDKRRG